MTATIRWFPYLSDKFNYVHAVLAWVIIAGSIWDISSIVVHDGRAFWTANHRVPAWIIMIAGLLGLAISGTASFMGRKLIRGDTRTVNKVRRAHRWIAFFIFVTSIFATANGI